MSVEHHVYKNEKTCPSCSREKFELEEITQKIENRKQIPNCLRDKLDVKNLNGTKRVDPPFSTYKCSNCGFGPAYFCDPNDVPKNYENDNLEHDLS